eukprot:SAG31_NODE_1751_length_7353_cov_6.874552_7_plen_75_part_00
MEFFVSGDTDGSGELDFHEFSSVRETCRRLHPLRANAVARLTVASCARAQALHAMNVQMHPADAELAFYTLDEE